MRPSARGSLRLERPLLSRARLRSTAGRTRPAQDLGPSTAVLMPGAARWASHFKNHLRLNPCCLSAKLEPLPGVAQAEERVASSCGSACPPAPCMV